MAFKCIFRERECNGCQNCMDIDENIDSLRYNIAGDFLDFNSIDRLINKEASDE